MDELKQDNYDDFAKIAYAMQSMQSNLLGTQDDQSKDLSRAMDQSAAKYLQDKLTESKSIIQMFEKEKASYLKDRERLLNENRKGVQEIEKMRHDIANMKNKQLDVEEEKNKEKHLRFNLEEEVSEFRLKLADEEERNEKVEGTVMKLREDVKMLCVEKADLKREIKDQMMLFAAFEKYNNEVIRFKDFHKAESEILRSKLVEQKKNVEEVQEFVKKNCEELQEQQMEILSFNDEIKRNYDVMRREFQFSYGIIANDLQNLKEINCNTRDELLDETCMTAKALEKCKYDCNCLQIENENLEVKLKELVEENQSTKTELAKKEEDVINKEHELDELTMEYEKVKKMVDAGVNEVSAQNESLKELKEKLREEKTRSEDLEASLKKKELLVAELEKQNERLKKDTVDIEKQLSKEQNSMKALKNEKKKLTNEVSKISSEMNQLEKQYKDTSEQVESLESKLHSSLSSQQMFELTLEETTAAVEQCKVENEEISAKYNEACDAIISKDRQILCAVEELNDLQQKYLQSCKKNVELEDALAKAGSDVERLHMRYAELENDNEEAMKRYEEIGDSKQIGEKKIQELENMLWHKGSVERSLKDKINQLEESMKILHDERNGLTEKIAEQKRKYAEELNNIERNFQDKCSIKDTQLEKQTSRKEILQMYLKRMEDQLNQKERQIDAKREELRSVLTRLSDVRNEKERCSRKVESLLVTEKNLSSKVDKLEKNIRVLEQKEQKLANDLNLKETEIKKINTQWAKTAASALETIEQELCCSSKQRVSWTMAYTLLWLQNEPIYLE
eukprot:gene8861-9810_t